MLHFFSLFLICVEIIGLLSERYIGAEVDTWPRVGSAVPRQRQTLIFVILFLRMDQTGTHCLLQTQDTPSYRQLQIMCKDSFIKVGLSV